MDTIGGTLERICKKEVDLQTIIESPGGQDKYLMHEIVQAADLAGIRPAGDEVLDFTIAPALGGSIDVSNLSVIDFVVKLNVAGQIHAQVRKMKPGTTISGISIDG